MHPVGASRQQPVGVSDDGREEGVRRRRRRSKGDRTQHGAPVVGEGLVAEVLWTLVGMLEGVSKVEEAFGALAASSYGAKA